MQYLLTKEEYDALKAVKGVPPEAVQCAKQEFKRRVVSILNRTTNFDFGVGSRLEPNGTSFVRELHDALHKFDNELNVAIEAAK